MSDYIEYTVPTNEDHWTDEDIEIPAMFLDRIERETGAFVAEKWPGVEFSVRLVPDTLSFGNRTRTSFDDDAERDVIETIDNWMSWLWPDWLAEALADAGG